MIKDRGQFKFNIKKCLYKNENLRQFLFDGENINITPHLFSERVKSHLFLDDILTDKKSYIFFDVICPQFTAQIKEIKIVMYVICHRDILDDYTQKDGYYGNRADVLSQAVEEALITDSAKEFGIGDLQLEGVDLYNGKDYYGTQLIFNVPTFR